MTCSRSHVSLWQSEVWNVDQSESKVRRISPLSCCRPSVLRNESTIKALNGSFKIYSFYMQTIVVLRKGRRKREITLWHAKAKQ